MFSIFFGAKSRSIKGHRPKLIQLKRPAAHVEPKGANTKKDETPKKRPAAKAEKPKKTIKDTVEKKKHESQVEETVSQKDEEVEIEEGGESEQPEVDLVESDTEQEPHPEPPKSDKKKKQDRMKRPSAATAEAPVANEGRRGQIISTVEYKSGWKIVKHRTQKGRVYPKWIRPSDDRAFFSAKSATENGFEEETS